MRISYKILRYFILPFLLFPVISQAERDLSFLKPTEILIGEKTFENQKDHIFRDSFGREAHFRGWNFSNASKYGNFLPFTSKADLIEKLTILRTQTGSNIIRWLVSWDAIEPEVDVININYLRQTNEALKIAIDMGFYILIDYHQDVFSPAVGGNGAPNWVVDGMKIKSSRCWLPIWCDFTEGLRKQSWAANYYLNRQAKTALRNFWNNKMIDTKEGKRFVQDEYIWMMKRSLSYWRENLSAKEFESIIGVDPWNEPAEGGLKEYKPPLSPADWHEEKLWPFYRKIREEINKIGYREKPLFAEPSTFWNIAIPLITARGHGFLKNIPKEGYVFNAHGYDEIREGFSAVGRVVENGAYFKELDDFREEGRYLGQPPFISEFGAWGNTKVFDANRIVKAMYQAMETSKTTNMKIPYTDFYVPLVSGTQWVNGVGRNENTGIYNDYTDPRTLERAYPRFAQGDFISFYYNDMAQASFEKVPLEWACIQLMREQYFAQNKFLWLVWRSNESKAPTEIFIPRHFKLEKTLLITDQHIFTGIHGLPLKPTGKANEIFRMDDLSSSNKGGSRIFIYNDNESVGTFHFALIVDLEESKPPNSKDIQSRLKKKVYLRESPIFLRGKVRIEKNKKAYPHAK